ncbi:MAG: S8 family serine peptidase, partial [Bdellovibrionales bacterium]|nr:S8 family serine peptidase [Bdellovibrionales bacterium]
KNYGQDSPMGIEGHKGADIGVLKAWQTHKGSKDIVVAVIDTGVDYSHPDLVSNMWVNLKEKNGVPGVDDDGNGYVDDIHGWDSVSDHRDRPYFGQVGDPDPMDDYGHGTHVAGTIGAVGGNGIGVVGVNWSVSIMAVKFLDEFGSGSTIDEYRAFKYILANKVDVVNGSYGGGGRSRLIEGMIQKGREQGILFVFAAGNETENLDVTPGYPASYPYDNVVSVAATDARDQLADFSNYGQTSVHVAAPGVDIYSTIPTKMKDEMGQWKTVDQPYASYSGTSMASPHVAGAAALLIAADTSLRHQPHLTKQRLMDTSELVPTLANAVVARGRISVDRAIANQTQSSLDLAGVWEEVEVNIQTPKFPQELVDNSWQLHYPGAKAIQVHVKFAQVESGFDVAYLYDYRFRPVLNLTGEVYDKWSPVIVGDSAYLKFSNSLVKIGDREAFANFNSEGVQIDKVKILK